MSEETSEVPPTTIEVTGAGGLSPTSTNETPVDVTVTPVQPVLELHLPVDEKPATTLNMPQTGVPWAGLAVGRIVHYVMATGECRAAVVVRVFAGHPDAEGMANLMVFLDGHNDTGDAAVFPAMGGQLMGNSFWWATSVHFSQEAIGGGVAHTWHWPERV